MRVDFYRLSRDTAENAVALLARKSVEADKRVLVVAEGRARLEQLSKTLWDSAPAAFLANGFAGDVGAAHQPILLAESVDHANAAQFAIIADGQWRDPGNAFDRVMLVFDDATIEAARGTWRTLGEDAAIERHFWKQDDTGRWVEGP